MAEPAEIGAAIHALEKRALVGDRDATIQLVSLFRQWRQAGDEMLAGPGMWCDAIRTYADKIEVAMDQLFEDE